MLASLTIAAFFLSSATVELIGSPEAIARVRGLIVLPGLLVLVPAIALAGASGFALSRSRTGRLVEAKKRRMPFIAANGILILLPCAVLLDRWAAAGAFGPAYLAVHALELAAGGANLALMGLNVRDGLRMAGRLRAPRAVAGPGG
jgi:hypothetical protein